MTTYRKVTTQPAVWLIAATRIGVVLIGALGSCGAQAASMTPKDVLILTKAIGFLPPAPSGLATIAIAYELDNADSKQDAEAIAGYFGDGLKAGNALLKPRLVEVGQLAAGGFVAVISAASVKVEQIAAATRALHVACITADTSAVQAGQCVMSVKSAPKVEILISRAAAARSNVGFGSAFLLMAHEL